MGGKGQAYSGSSAGRSSIFQTSPGLSTRAATTSASPLLLHFFLTKGKGSSYLDAQMTTFCTYICYKHTRTHSQMYPNSIHITAVLVEYETRTGRTNRGVATSWLKRQQNISTNGM